MEAVFLKILNMSINASWFVLAVILLRLVLNKAPKKIRVVLWSLVGVRLVLPFKLESVFSFLPSSETIPQNITMTPTPEIQSGIPALNSAINPVLSESFAPNPGDSANPLQIITFIAAVLWIIGMVAMLVYTLVTYIAVRRKTSESIPLKDNVCICDRVATPFILGVFRPKIYLPSDMNEADMQFVLAHEKAHLKRKDHLWKPLGFLLLSVYWFNPIMWLAYVLLCRDIELACDEKVIAQLGTEIKKPYAEALVNCSVPKKLITACPVAFGETGVKGRIKSVLSYKKPALWLIIIAVLVSSVVAVGFMTDPKGDASDIFGKTYRGELVYQPESLSFANVYMGYCDISDEGRLSIAHIDHIVDYGKMKESDFDNAEFVSLTTDTPDGILSFSEISKAYELTVSTADAGEHRFVIFVTDDDRVYRVDIAMESIVAVFRLYETELFDEDLEPSLGREVKEAILERNKDNYYIAKNKDKWDDGTITLSVVSYYSGHELHNADNDTVTVYDTMLYEEYVKYPDGSVRNVASQSSPVKLVFKKQKQGEYKLIKYVQPNPEMKGMPEDFVENLFNEPGYDDAAIMKMLRAECHDKVTAYFGLFSSDSADSDYALYGNSEQNIFVHRENACGTYFDPYVLGEGVRLRHSEINTSGSINPEDVTIYDYNLTFRDALSGDKALQKLKKECKNFEEEKHILEDNDLYLVDVEISYNDTSDKKDFAPVTVFLGAVNSDGELINTENRFDIEDFSNTAEDGVVRNWYSLLVPKGQEFRTVFVIGSIFEAPGPVQMIYYDITSRERKPAVPETAISLYADKITYDIDNDTVKENCYITAGPTSGLFTFCVAAFHGGQLEYFNIFAPEQYLNCSFQINEYTDKLQIIGTPVSETATSYVYTYDVTVERSEADGDNIRLNDLKYWGEQGIESPWADFSKSLQKLEYTDELRGRYPFYFDLPTDKGLAVYVWQMSESNYQCTLVADKSIEHPMKIVLNNEGVSIKAMKYILESYNLSENDIAIRPYRNPASSYFYEIDEAYQKKINAEFGR